MSPRLLPMTPTTQGFYTGNLSKSFALEVTDNGTMRWMAENMGHISRATAAQLKYMQENIARELAKQLGERAPRSAGKPNAHPDPRFSGPLAESFAVAQSGDNYQVTTSELLKFRVQSEGARAAKLTVRPIPIPGSEYARVSWSRQGEPRLRLWWPQLGPGNTLAYVNGHPVDKNPFYDEAWQHVTGPYMQNVLNSAVYQVTLITTGEAAPSYTEAGRLESPWGRTYKATRGLKQGLTWYRKRLGLG